MRAAIRVMGLFGASAGFCFSMARAGVAQASYWTIDAAVSCNGTDGTSSSPRRCALVNSTVNFPISSMTTACARFYLSGGVTYDNFIVKQSFTGSLYQDWNTFHQASSGYNTLCVGAGNVLTNASPYDYLYFQEASENGSTIGMDTVTVNSSGTVVH
ncbi:MAG TPA: hypothetical protein VHL80_16965 [Polyangia bacterium]|nr:hypothetical protein [Polyangia bacterium]